MSPTITTPAMTQMGMILGTAAYMSPEQARGKTVDSATDIWAFGCVLYEILTARPAFPGETVTDVIAKIIEGRPNMDLLPAETPSSIRMLLSSVLTKEPRQRLQHIGDSRSFFNATFAPAASKPEIALPPSRWRWLVPSALSVVLLAALIPATLFFLRAPAEQQEVRFEIPAPGMVSFPMVSPDGKRVAWIGVTEGKNRIWIHQMASLGAEPLRGTDNAVVLCCWSPDSRSIAFFAEGKLEETRAVCRLTDSADGQWLLRRRRGRLVEPKGHHSHFDGVFRFPRLTRNLPRSGIGRNHNACYRSRPTRSRGR